MERTPERWTSERAPLAHLSAAEQAALRARARWGAALIALGIAGILWGTLHVVLAVGGPEKPEFAHRQTYDEVKPIVQRTYFGGLVRALAGLALAICGGRLRGGALRQLFGAELRVQTKAPSFRVKQSASSALWDAGWFDLTTFEVEGAAPGDASGVLERFLRDPISERAYVADATAAPPNALRAGLRAEWYRPISRQELAQSVRGILSDPRFASRPAPEQVRPVEAWLAEVEARGPSVLELRAPEGTTSSAAAGFVWFLYREFVCVSADGTQLTTAILAYD